MIFRLKLDLPNDNYNILMSLNKYVYQFFSIKGNWIVEIGWRDNNCEKHDLYTYASFYSSNDHYLIKWVIVVILTVPPFKLVYLSNCDQHEHEAEICNSIWSTCFAKRLTISEDVILMIKYANVKVKSIFSFVDSVLLAHLADNKLL